VLARCKVGVNDVLLVC